MNLIQIMNNQILESESKPKTSHWPSEVEDCKRKIWYKWKSTKETNPMEPGALFKTRMGRAVELLVNELLTGAGIKLKEQIRGEYSHPALKHKITYYMDNTFIEGGNSVGVEVKSTYGRGVSSVKTEGPKNEHISQCQLYMGMEEIDKFYLLYFARDNGDRWQFEIQFNQNHFNKCIEKFNKIESLLEKDVPERDFIAPIKNGEIKPFQKNNIKYNGDWQCRYCQFRNLCWSEELKKYMKGDNSECLNSHLAE